MGEVRWFSRTDRSLVVGDAVARMGQIYPVRMGVRARRPVYAGGRDLTKGESSPRRFCKLQPSEAQERRQRVVVECVAEIIVRVSYLCIDELE